MSNARNAGDVVMLKSDGPAMTVQRLDGGDVECVWFSGKIQKP